MRPLKRTEIKRFFERLPPLKGEIVFCLTNSDKPANVGSIFRLAEGLNAKVWLCGHTPVPPNPQISVTSMNQEARVEWQHFTFAHEAIREAKKQGYKTIAVEICQGAKPYAEYPYPKKICFVLGNENTGVPQEILSICDEVVFIPYYGKNYSYNVAVSGAMVASHVCFGTLDDNG